MKCLVERVVARREGHLARKSKSVHISLVECAFAYALWSDVMDYCYIVIERSSLLSMFTTIIHELTS